MKGGCHCGAVRYEVIGEPIDADFCHCRDCQRTTGAPVGVWADFNAAQFRLLAGEIKEYASSEKVRRGFCADCGCSLSYRRIDYPQYFTVSIASLDDPNAVTPNYHIHTDNQVNWMPINDELEKYARARNKSG